MNKNEALNAILLKPKCVLVEYLPDYFKKKSAEGFSTDIEENNNFFVGVIRKGFNLNLENRVIYYEKHMSPVIKIKDVGTYHLVNMEHHMLIVRTDEIINP